MSAIEGRLNDLVKNALDGAGIFYSIRNEPIPTKTCFDVNFKTYSNPPSEYTATVKIPNNYPFAPPVIVLKNDKGQKPKFKFLSKELWKASMSIREVLIEAAHELSRRDLKSKQPLLPDIQSRFRKSPIVTSPS